MDNRIKINTCIYRKDIIHKGKRKKNWSFTPCNESSQCMACNERFYFAKLWQRYKMTK